MAVWIVRAGKIGEGEDFALREGLAVINFGELKDLATVGSRVEIEDKLRASNPDAKANTIANWARQVWAFRTTIKAGDLVVIPLKTTNAIAVGEVTGEYQFRPDSPSYARHTRPVRWIRNDLPRSTFDQDILYSFGAFLTVCQVSRNNAEERIRAVLQGKT